MNKWQDYTVPLNKQSRPRNKYINLNENIDPGVELKVPSPDPQLVEKNRQRKQNRLDELWEQVSRGNVNALKDKYATKTKKNQSSFGMYLPPAESNGLPTISNGRVVKPDPVRNIKLRLYNILYKVENSTSLGYFLRHFFPIFILY